MSGVVASVKGLQTFRPYAEYSDSKIPWAGRMPAHWKSARTKFVARLESGHTPSRQHPEYWANCTLPWFGLADVWQIRDGKTDYVTETKEKVSELGLANSSARKLPAGTVILSRTASVGFSAIMGCEMATTQDFANWVCSSKILPKYLLYVLRAMKPEFKRLTMGSTHQTIYMPDIGKFCTVLPPTDEQRAIAEFLDRETGRIDALVAKKERLIELLQEKRTALITHAVTKGLDPNAPAKPSGIDWLGDIPAHWNARKMAYIAEMSSGGTPSKDNLEYWRGEIPWVSPKDMKIRVIADTIDHVSESALEETGLELIDPHAVLIVVRGMILVHTFPVAYTTAAITINQDMKALRLVQDVDPNYFVYLLQGIGKFVLSLVEESGHGTKRLRTDLWRAIKLYLPSLDEQKQIAISLDIDSARLDELIVRTREGIELLNEFRTALVSAAVTGKIDVREEVE